jgi:hypothetical protein
MEEGNKYEEEGEKERMVRDEVDQIITYMQHCLKGGRERS